MKTPRMCLALALTLGTSVFAQQSRVSVPNRIAGPIDESRLVTLHGNVHPLARASSDRGPVDPSLPLTDLVLVLRRSPDQQAAFDAFVARQYDPSSPDFHRWLTPADVAARFGPTAADAAAVSAWLTSYGLAVNEIASDRMSIRFGGTAAQVQAAFHTSLHQISASGEQHIANMSDPSIPAALGPVVLGVKALHNFLPRPEHHIGSTVSFNPDTGRWQRSPSAAAKPALGAINPDLGITIGSGTNQYTIEDVAPYDFATIYNVLPLWNESTPIDGTGQTIAIAGTSDINLNDVSSFRQVFGLPAGAAPKIVVANGVDPGQCIAEQGACTFDDLVENSLDVEWSGAVAKGASVVLVVSGQTSPMTDTVYSSANYVVQNSTAKILSVSYGECELGLGTAGNAAYNNLWETAATEGIAVFVAAGDAGAATCDQGQAQQVPYTAQYGLSVSGIASTPFDTAVGGTDLNWGNTPSPYWNSSNNSSTGASAAGYMPEVPWNDTCTNPVILPILQEWAAALIKAGYSAVSPTDAESACNFVNQWWSIIYDNTSPQVNLAFLIDTVGGGGGASNCTTGDGSTIASCSGGYPKPSWQSSVTGIPADGLRDLPDVTFFAGNGLLGSAYLVCVSAAGPCLASTNPTSEPIAQEIGGTSAGTPAMAGVMALINQKMGASQGSPNAELYSIAAKESYGSCSSETPGNSCSFHDVDTGTISMPCGSGSADCTIKRSGDSIGLLSGYSATTGFDPASGLGSLNVANVVNAWTSTVGTTPATVTVTPAQSSIPINQALSIAVQVSGSSGTPTGNVTVAGGGYDGGAQALASGAYTFSIPANTLPAGSVTITGSYAGDSTYAESSATASVTVTKLTPTVTIQLNPASVGANTQVQAVVTVAGPSGSPNPTGTIQLAGGGYTSGSCTLASGVCTVTIPPNTLSNGNDTMTATYSGDSVYQSETGTAVEMVNALTPTVKITPAVMTVDTVTTLQVALTVTGSGPVPTGSVTLFGLLGGSPTQGYGLGCALVSGSCTISVPGGQLLPPADTLGATYFGDSNYFQASSPTVTITVIKSNPTFSATPVLTSISTNQALEITGSVTSPAEPPSGSVTFSGGGYTGSTLVGNTFSSSFDFKIPPGSLTAGTDTITVTYAGDNFFNSAATSFSVNVTQWTKIAPTITITPASNSIDLGQLLNISVSISGANGQGTGTVTLTSGNWNSGPATVQGGTAYIMAQPNSLAVGTDTLTANYSGDATYLSGTSSATVTVNASSFTLAASNPSAISPGASAESDVQVQTSNGYSGTVTFACSLTSQPAGAINLPTCHAQNEVVLPSDSGSYIGEMEVLTTASSASLIRRPNPGLGAFGGTTLAFLVLLGIRARRRAWRNLLGLVVLAFVFASLGACGGGGANGGGGGGGGGGTSSGTTAGTYTFTVTGTGNPAVTPAPTTTFTLTVN